MKRSVACIVSVVLSGICNLAPVFAGTPSGNMPLTLRYDDYHEITARRGMLVDGEGRTGDSMRYDGNLPEGERSDLNALVLPDVESPERGISWADHELRGDIERELTWSRMWILTTSR